MTLHLRCCLVSATHAIPVDALNAVAQGVLTGVGRPGIGALLNAAGYWGLGMPLACYLGLYLGWGVKGFWTALLTTSAVMSGVQFMIILGLSWWSEVQRAAARMAEQEEQAADNKAAELGSLLGKPMLIRGISNASSNGSLIEALSSEESYRMNHVEVRETPSEVGAAQPLDEGCSFAVAPPAVVDAIDVVVQQVGAKVAGFEAAAVK